MNESVNGIWWRLPGPSRFVERIVDAIRNGRHVIICRPETACEGLVEAVMTALQDEESGQRTRLSVTEDEFASPIDEFYDRYVQDTDPADIRNARSLAREDEMAARFFWVTDMTQAAWKTWADFILEFQQASMAVEVFERPVVCIELRGTLAAERPEEDVCLAILSEQGTSSETDALLFASELTYDRTDRPVIKQLRAHLIARLAQWDATLATRLSQCELQLLLKPQRFLESYARELGWKRSDVPLWHTGMLGTMDENEKTHSAAMVIDKFNGGIERRLWAAQVSVLLPHVEIERQKFITQYGSLLTVPYETQYGQTVNNLGDLEIGHILHQSSVRQLSLPHSKRRHLKQLRDIRNALSHLECVTCSLLEDI